VIDNKAYFKSNNERYNDFVVEFQYDKDYPTDVTLLSRRIINLKEIT